MHTPILDKQIQVKVTIQTIYDEVWTTVYADDTEETLKTRLMDDINCGDQPLREYQILDLWVQDIELPANALDFPQEQIA